MTFYKNFRMNDKVSIVIPVYNSAKYLEETLESALNQTYPNIEIISVIRPGEDNSMEILKNYSDKISIIRKPSIKQFAAFNLGIKEMTGEWFKFFSSDDVLYPNTIEELISATKENPENKEIIYYSNFDIIDSNGNIIAEKMLTDDSNQTLFEKNIRLLNGFYGNPNGSLVHRDVFTKYGLFNEDFEIVGDYEMWLRLCLLYDFRMQLIPKKLFKYRTHKDTVSHNYLSLKDLYKAKYFILNKLESESRAKYETELKKYQNYTLETRFLLFAYKYFLQYLPFSIFKKIHHGYRSIRNLPVDVSLINIKKS